MTLSSGSVEFRIKAALCVLVCVFMGMAGAIAYALDWSLLAIATLLCVLSYPLCWSAWKVWQLWSSSLMRLTTYTQSLAMGESGIQPSRLGKSVLFDDLCREITLLHQRSQGQMEQNRTLSALFTQLFEDIPIAIIAFDANQTLIYANRAAYQITDIGLLQGMTASELGFVLKKQQYSHPALTPNWRCQSSTLRYMDQSSHLFTAIDISSELKQSEQAVQKNLVRVLSHELRNTLTPMSSMAETLLSMEKWDSDQIRTVLVRVKARADGLLTFVQRFAEVAKIPEPQKELFDIEQIVEQTKVLLRDGDTIEFSGQPSCYADPQLIAQVLMNLVKNAVEACDGQSANIRISHYLSEQRQHLCVEDNGSGFSNLENAITPLFTTKANGAGIGLAFVEAVLNKHNGKVSLSNSPAGGAKVALSWPL
ncbi:sensor histidine kinase [Alteromonas sediminis]|uniref:sensor histidine kinase n=1 Tax=Alteromonas sediminis TaxID=2259342 RepID=UPI0014043595|nr:PAS domain-containing sensor histidine kinase [Alteromonas sediminis]